MANNIYPEVEVIAGDPNQIDGAYHNIVDSKEKFRCVIDAKTIK